MSVTRYRPVVSIIATAVALIMTLTFMSVLVYKFKVRMSDIHDLKSNFRGGHLKRLTKFHHHQKQLRPVDWHPKNGTKAVLGHHRTHHELNRDLNGTHHGPNRGHHGTHHEPNHHSKRSNHSTHSNRTARGSRSPTRLHSLLDSRPLDGGLGLSERPDDFNLQLWVEVMSKAISSSEFKAPARRGRPPARKGISPSLFLGRSRHKLRYPSSDEDEDKRSSRKKAKRKDAKRKKSKRRHKSKSNPERRLQLHEICLPILSQTLELSEEEEDDRPEETKAKAVSLCVVPKLAYSSPRPGGSIGLGVVADSHCRLPIPSLGVFQARHHCLIDKGRPSGRDMNQIKCLSCSSNFALYSKYMEHLRFSACGLSQQRLIMNAPHQELEEVGSNFPTNPAERSQSGAWGSDNQELLTGTSSHPEEDRLHFSRRSPLKASTSSLSSFSRSASSTEWEQKHYINELSASSRSPPKESPLMSRVLALNNFVQQHGKREHGPISNTQSVVKKRKQMERSASGKVLGTQCDWDRYGHLNGLPDGGSGAFQTVVRPPPHGMWGPSGFPGRPGPQPYQPGMHLHHFNNQQPQWMGNPVSSPWNVRLPPGYFMNTPSQQYPHATSVPFQGHHHQWQSQTWNNGTRSNAALFRPQQYPHHSQSKVASRLELPGMSSPAIYGGGGQDQRRFSNNYPGASHIEAPPEHVKEIRFRDEPMDEGERPPRPSSDEDVIRAAAEAIARDKGHLPDTFNDSNNEVLFQEICSEVPFEAHQDSMEFHDSFGFDDLGSLGTLMNFVHTTREPSSEPPSLLKAAEHPDQSSQPLSQVILHSACLKEDSQDPILAAVVSSTLPELPAEDGNQTLFDFTTKESHGMESTPNTSHLNHESLTQVQDPNPPRCIHPKADQSMFDPDLAEAFHQMKYEVLSAQTRYVMLLLLPKEECLGLDLVSRAVHEALKQYLRRGNEPLEEVAKCLRASDQGDVPKWNFLRQRYEDLRANIGQFLAQLLPAFKDWNHLSTQSHSVDEILEILSRKTNMKKDLVQDHAQEEHGTADSTTKLQWNAKRDETAGGGEEAKSEETLVMAPNFRDAEEPIELMVDPQDEIINDNS